MDNQEGKVHFTEGAMCHCGRNHHWAWHLLKWLLVLLAVVLAFAAGVKAGRHAASWGEFAGPRGSVGMSTMMSGRGMMGWAGGQRGPALDQVFGTISQISGSTITVTDNGGKTQTVVSQSNTIIVIGNQELALASLKVGQTIRAAGTLDKDGHLQADVIQLAGL